MRLSAKPQGPGSELEALRRGRARSLRARRELVVVASSTGGPGALRELLLKLPAQLPVPIVVVQHLPPSFVVTFARQLDRRLALKVQLASVGAEVSPGRVWFAPGSEHLTVRRDPQGVLRFGQESGPPVAGCRPAADVLFRSAARAVGAGSLAIVLTGMGNDGCAGAREIVACGGEVLVQDKASSAVWGMPGSIVRAGIEARILPLTNMAAELIDS